MEKTAYKILFQPTRPLRGATVISLSWATISSKISTHAPLAGRDRLTRRIHDFLIISTHAPLAGRDVMISANDAEKMAFQPTRPLRGATVQPSNAPVVPVISTHAPLAGRDDPCDGVGQQRRRISTHAPLAGRDSG